MKSTRWNCDRFSVYKSLRLGSESLSDYEYGVWDLQTQTFPFLHLQTLQEAHEFVRALNKTQKTLYGSPYAKTH